MITPAASSSCGAESRPDTGEFLPLTQSDQVAAHAARRTGGPVVTSQDKVSMVESRDGTRIVFDR
jgi:hypothetical protein